MLYRGGVIKRIAEIGEIRMCKRIMKHQTAPVGDVPFYKIGTFGGTADAFISREIFESFRSQYPYPRKGQVLLSAAGTIGRSVVFDGSDSYYQDSNIVWIDTDESIVNNLFLHYCFKYLVDWNQYKTSGSVISRLYNDDLRAISIPFPSVEIQTNFAQQIKELEAKITGLEVDVSENDKRKAAILHKYI